MMAYDFLQILLDAPEEKGLHDDVMSVVEAGDFEVPIFNPNSITGTDDIRITDRDVILPRSNCPVETFSVYQHTGRELSIQNHVKSSGVAHRYSEQLD